MNKYAFYNVNEIRPLGWLKRQLEIQRDGLSGNLDLIWRDVSESKWVGGSCEGWERVPYWLDGFLPLAYLLDDADMKSRAKKYIDAIIDGQQEDGWICPCSESERATYDTWPVELISKVLLLYYDCSGDTRIQSVLYKTLKCYYEMLKNGTIKLFEWGKYRWFEIFPAIEFLRERYSEKWITELADIMMAQGFDYASAAGKWVRPIYKWTFETHVVNLAMMLKTEAVTDFATEKYRGEAERLYSLLMKYNGTPTGIFTGDECLAGLSPVRGTELCAVAELMYSFEILYAYSGDKKWAELLEKVAFNALPATISDDMWAHQYDQLSNQISAAIFPGKPIFGTNGKESMIFGLEPNYGCCTANFNQAWPKFALSSFLRDGDDVVSAVPVPSALDTGDISVTLETEYPFKNRLCYTVGKGREFTLKIRVPSFAENLTVNGKPQVKTDMLKIKIAKDTEYEIIVSFDVSAHLTERPYGLTVAERGSLVFSLPVGYEKIPHEYERDGVVRKHPYCDYEYIGNTEWRYGISEDPRAVNENPVSDVPFSSENPPLTLDVPVRRIDWEYEDGYEFVAAKNPQNRAPVGETEIKRFYPYGCAKLRVTELPKIK